MSAKIHPLPAMPLLAEPPTWNGSGWIGARPEEVGKSVLGNTINLYRGEPSPLLVMGGVHGDESEGIFLAHLLLGARPGLSIMPCLNPDGALLRQRWNARNVDLNRNLPTKDWRPTPTNPRYPPGAAPASEPETRAFLRALEATQPSTVLSLHSYKESFVEIERPAENLSPDINAAVSRFTDSAGIERRVSIGYPTPGALGAYGREHDLLVLTYELRRGASHGELHDLLPQLCALVDDLAMHRFRVIGE
jgi:protein MpaA